MPSATANATSAVPGSVTAYWATPASRPPAQAPSPPPRSSSRHIAAAALAPRSAGWWKNRR
jgi:hypothetical protein